jgi:hypothetical protein
VEVEGKAANPEWQPWPKHQQKPHKDYDDTHHHEQSSELLHTDILAANDAIGGNIIGVPGVPRG